MTTPEHDDRTDRITTPRRIATWGMWANTGDVDPVLARMLHLLRHHWRAAPKAAGALSELDTIVEGTRGDDALSRRRALFVVDRALRRDLPRLLRAPPRGEGAVTTLAATSLEQLAPLESARFAGRAVALTFDLGRRVDGIERRLMGVAWEAARHTEQGLFAGRIYQLGSAAVSACEMFAAPSLRLAGTDRSRALLCASSAIGLIHGAALLQ